MTVWAKDLEIGFGAWTPFVSGVYMVDVEEPVFGGVQTAFLASPTDITEWQFEDKVKLIESIQRTLAQFSVIVWQAKGVDSYYPKSTRPGMFKSVIVVGLSGIMSEFSGNAVSGDSSIPQPIVFQAAQSGFFGAAGKALPLSFKPA